MKKIFKNIDLDIYNQISNNPKFFRRSFIILTFLFLTAFATQYKNVFSDQNVSFYTFSTIVQGFLALIGFLGTVVIFKLQLIENNAQSVRDGLVIFLKDYNGNIAYTYSWIEAMNTVKDLNQGGNLSMHAEQLKNGCNKLEQYSEEKSNLRKIMIDFSVISLINISVALVGLPFSKYLLFNNLYLVNSIYMLFNIGLSISSVFLAIKLIRSSLGYSFSL